MRVAIISDVHNNITSLRKVLKYCAKKKIKEIICCGDLASLGTLNFLNEKFKGTIYYTFGNMDNEQLKNIETLTLEHANIYPEFGEANVEKRKVAFTHYPNDARELAETGKYDFVFHGHTHKPWMEKIGSCIVINPGNVAGEIYPATFAVWDTGDNKFLLIRIQSLK